MWIVIGMADSHKVAQEMKGALEKEGILVKMRNVSSKTRSSGDTYELLVLESEGTAAREIMLELGY